MIIDLDDFMERIYKQLGQSASLLVGEYDDEDSDYGTAANTALNEMGLSLPLDNSKLEFWLLSRGKRHAIDIIRLSSARKFKYKQIHLDQRFHHFDVIIKEMDEMYGYALETDAELMGLIGDDAKNYISYIRPGFVYTNEGKDVTYQDWSHLE